MDLYIFGVFWILSVCGVTCGPVEEIYYWKDVIYEDLPYKEDSSIGNYPYYIPENNDVLGIAYHAQSGLMVTTVGRLRPGVPSVLNAFCVNDYNVGTSPHLWGFPDYEKNTLKASFHDQRTGREVREKKGNNSSGFFNHYGEYGTISQTDEKRKYPYNYYALEHFSIISTYHPVVDDYCNRLFVFDTGTLYYGPSDIHYVQSPAIVVFDLPSNGCYSRKFPVIRRVEVPRNLFSYNSTIGFGWVTVDQQPNGSCDDIFLYIPNVLDNTLLVYDYKRNNFWVHEDITMRSIFAESYFTFKDQFYQFLFGVGKVALGWPDKRGNRKAYFAPVASTVEYSVSTQVFKKSSYKSISGEYSLLGHRGCSSQTFGPVFDEATGVIFFPEIQSHRIRCWNTHLPLNPDTVGTVFESKLILFASSLHVDSNEYLWVLSNYLPQIFLTDIPLDITQINSRIFRVKVTDAIKGTVCDVPFYT